MQSKTLKYVLITGVIIIWGVVIYKIINASEKQLPSQIFTSGENVETAQADSFALNADYPDPFLSSSKEDSTIIAEEAVPVSQQGSVPAVKETKPDLSFIQYSGMIRNPVRKKKVGIVQMHGREYLVRENEEFGQVTFVRIKPEELIILFDGKRHRISKQP